MKCPYRIETKSHYAPDESVTEQCFAECYEELCPFYEKGRNTTPSCRRVERDLDD